MQYIVQALSKPNVRLGLVVFALASLLYCVAAWERVAEPSRDIHFVYLANTYNSMIAASFSDEAANLREGKAAFELDHPPPHRNDWASYWELTLQNGETYRGTWVDRVGHGRFRLLGTSETLMFERDQVDHNLTLRRYFVSFPPAPAWFMMPFAAVWGYNVNDVLFTIFFASLNVVLTFLLLQRLSVQGLSRMSQSENLWLTAMFGFGTAHFWSSVLGQVWFTALIMGVSFTLLYIWCAIDARRPLLAGIFLALAFATRTPLVFTAIFFFAFLLFPHGRWRREYWGEAFKKATLFCIPCLVVGLGLLWMNYVRFESWTEFGHRYLAGGMIPRIQEYGLFHLHFLSKNLTAMLTLLPKVQSEYPYVIVSRHGMSMLLTTPALFYLFRPSQERVQSVQKFWWRVLWLTVVVCAMPALFYQNTGYEQFGYRFSLDFMPYLILLLAVGQMQLSALFKACVIAGIVINTFGAIIFKRFGQFFSNDFFL